MKKLIITLNPQERQEYVKKLLKLDGLQDIVENPTEAYCPISLTSVPEELKPILQKRQEILQNKILKNAGIVAYDPASAPYSPDKNLISTPAEIYLTDSQKIVGARYFVGHNIMPTTGVGVEIEKAKNYCRVAVLLMDKNIRVSRMIPNRIICLQYENFESQSDRFVEVFNFLQNYEPGIGLDDGQPVLLGFKNTTGEVVNLEKTIYENFPDLKYQYDGDKSIVELKSVNTEIFAN